MSLGPYLHLNVRPGWIPWNYWWKSSQRGTLATGYLPGGGRFGAARSAPETRIVPLDGTAAICSPTNYTNGATRHGGEYCRPWRVVKKCARYYSYGTGISDN